jgi:hypothetical protein
MKKNVIILTHGWSGSSLFASLLRRAGYWIGDDTFKKPDYDTFENAELVALNRRLLEMLAPGINYEHRFEVKDIELMAERSRTLDLEPYSVFVARCVANAPWLWKDPRLTWTIRVWAKVLPLREIAFLILTRDDLQAWISCNERRHIQSMWFTRYYNHGITRSNQQFLDDHRLPSLALSFDDLMLEPESTLERMNAFFGTALSMGDLHSVCNIPLGSKSKDWKALLHAMLIYVKNYSERDGRARLGVATKRRSSAQA